MLLRNVFIADGDFIIRAIITDNMPAHGNESISYGHYLDNVVSDYIGIFTSNKKVYKIEDNGSLVGFYIVDYDTQNNPFFAGWKARKAYQVFNDTIKDKIQEWVATEMPVVVFL